jgi:hypothetical protein
MELYTLASRISRSAHDRHPSLPPTHPLLKLIRCPSQNADAISAFATLVAFSNPKG